MGSGSSSRRYRKTERARLEDETRRRITEAAVELHGTVGPANTSITDVAMLAGVTRMTVYNHFPTEIDLFVACSTHWAAANPFPDPSRWKEVEDPSERLVSALKELYDWYRAKQGMLGNIFRDAPALPSLAAVMEDLWSTYVDEVLRVLAYGRKVRGAEARDLKATLKIVVDFGTWHLLSESGVGQKRAAELAARMVDGAIKR